MEKTFDIQWPFDCFGLVATGATLGVLAILLILFLIILCLPWNKCSQYCSCCRCWIFNSNEHIRRQSEDAFRATRMPGEFPMPMFDFIPPYALPKLPNYEECVNTGPPANDEAPPPPTPLSFHSTNSNNQPALRLTLHGQPENLANTSDSQSLPLSTPPPSYSSTYLNRPSVTGQTGEDSTRLADIAS
ncbi:unnamed protein product, partial [Schistosoma turkestanicum]